MIAFVCDYNKFIAYLGTVAPVQHLPPLLHRPRQSAIVSIFCCSATRMRSLHRICMVSTAPGEDQIDGNESNDDDGSQNNEDEDEMLQMTDTLVKIMV
jgi:hypothetical protein